MYMRCGARLICNIQVHVSSCNERVMLPSVYLYPKPFNTATVESISTLGLDADLKRHSEALE